jgi:predicted ATPase
MPQVPPNPAAATGSEIPRAVGRIVLTGGPGAGKTTVGRRIVARHPDRFVLVPEAATQVYDALRTRWDRLDVEGRREVQRRIYRLQVEQEQRMARDHRDRILLLDRGTVDGAAYWPDGAADYWRDLGTDHATELRRYDAVIWLQSCAVLGLYDGSSSNACRFEDSAAAIDTGERLLELWRAHPRLHRVDACGTLEEKVAAVELLIRGESSGV